MLDESTLSLGRAMKHIRVLAGRSQRDLAEQLGVDPTYISHLEKDRRDPSVKFLRRFAAISEVSVAALIAVALWADLDENERAAFRPLMSSLLRLSTAPAARIPGGS